MPDDKNFSTPGHGPTGLDPLWAQALGALRHGLYFLTTGTLAAPRGMLVSWVSQVGGRPPLVLAAVRENRTPLPDLETRRAFALNLLSAEDVDLVSDLARPAAKRLEGVGLAEGPLGLPVLVRGPGALCCRVREVWRPGDHMLFLGELQGALWRGGGENMLAVGGTHAYLGLS